MKRIHATVGAALFAASLIGGGAAVAADDKADKTQTTTNKADSTQVMPSREDLKPGAAPTVPRMGDNAQRQHDRNSGANAGAAKGQTGAAATTASNADVRDWAQIDKNGDNLIGPEEMEEWLKQAGPQAPKK